MLQMKKSVTVHCGFYNENGGFRVSDVDREYMRSCEVVVATCAFGGGDDLHQPIGMTKNSIRKVSCHSCIGGYYLQLFFPVC